MVILGCQTSVAICRAVSPVQQLFECVSNVATFCQHDLWQHFAVDTGLNIHKPQNLIITERFSELSEVKQSV